MRENEALRDRLARLSEASLRINESLDFDTVLQGVLDSARALTKARYGVITLLDETGQLQDFLSSGMSSREAERLWEMTGGRRLFDYLSGAQEPLRVTDLLGGGDGHRQRPPVPGRAPGQGRPGDADPNLAPVGVAVFDARTGVPVSFNLEAKKRIVDSLREPAQSPEQLLETLTCRRGDGRELSLAYPPGPARSSPPRQVVLQHVDLVENPTTAARLELYHGDDASALHFTCFLSQPVSPDWLDAHHRLRRELGWRDHHRFGAAGAAPVCPALVVPWYLSGRVRGGSVSPPCGTMRDDAGRY